MALTRAKKLELVDELTQLLKSSKLTVVAKYAGTSVKSMQALKSAGNKDQTTIKVAKNRLVKKALSQIDEFANADSSALNGPLLYAFNANDEVLPAKVLAEFAKTEPQLQFVGAYTPDGQFLAADDVKALAALPSKDQLRGQLVGVFKVPLNGFVGVVSANLRGALNVLNARAQSLASNK